MNKINGLLIDVYSDVGSVKEVFIDENDLESFYKILDCRIIDIAVRDVDGKRFNIVCDDEGRLRENARVSACDEEGNPMLVGNLLFCNNDGASLSSLSKDDISHICKNISACVEIDSGSPKVFPVVCNVSY